MIYSAVGEIVSFQGREFVSTAKNEAGFALFGPYETFAPGQYSVAFKVHLPSDQRDAVLDTEICCLVDIVSDFGHSSIAQRHGLASMLKDDEATILMDFELKEARVLEFRIYSYGVAPLFVGSDREVTAKAANGSRFSPILARDDDPHDELFVGHFRNFLDLYYKGAKITPTPEGTVVHFLGVRFVVKNPEDFQLIWEILQSNVYNFNTEHDVCVIDIGMNVGLASLYFAGMPNVKIVHGFEPFEVPFKRAVQHFALNPERQGKIRPHLFGLGGQAEELSVLYDEAATISGSVRGRSSGIETTISIRDASEVLSRIIEEVRHQGLQIVVKMDCEGSEFGILERLDASGLLSEIRILMMEWHKWWSPDRTQRELISRLTKNGFDVLDHTDPFNPHAGMLYGIRTAAA